MSFLFPGFLVALFAILIPVLIHLFSFRRYKTVYFSNVDYLIQIKNEAEKKSRLKHLLILTARILAIAGLVFAFAQPYLPTRDPAPAHPDPVVAVYIDNSFSMNAMSPKGQLLEVARNKALEIAQAYPPGTRFRVITNDLLARHQHLFNKEQFIQQVSEIKTSTRTLPLSLVHNRMAEGSGPREVSAHTLLYSLSDFQSSVCDFGNFRGDSNLVNYLMPLTGGLTGNLAIDTCWMELPAHKINDEEIVKVRISNYSDQPYQNIPLRFYLDDTLKALASFSIDAGGIQTVELKYMNLKKGHHTGHAEISDYPFIHDNTYYLNYKVQDQLSVLAVSGKNPPAGSGLPYLRALFNGDEYLHFEESLVENLQISRLANFNTILLLNLREIGTGLVNELKKATANGATVLFFPEPEGNTESYNFFLGEMKSNRIVRADTATRPLAGIEWDHPLFEQTFKNKTETPDFPAIEGSIRFTEDTRIPETRLLWFRDNGKAVSIQASHRGNLVVFGFPLSPLNDRFARDILFVPLVYSLVINCLEQQTLAYTIGQETVASLGRQSLRSGSSLTVRFGEPAREFVPEVRISDDNLVRIFLSGLFDEAGHYRVMAGDSLAGIISMNYNRRESDLQYLTPRELAAAIENNSLRNCQVLENPDSNFSELLSDIRTGRKLWKYFLGLALLFLLAEALLVRFWK